MKKNKKKTLKVRDTAPKKDAKGGFGFSAMGVAAQIATGGQTTTGSGGVSGEQQRPHTQNIEIDS